MKIIKLLCGLVTIFFGFTLLTTSVLAVSSSPEPKVDSFELFWPIVAGKVRGDSFYSLKIFKEKIRESLIFSSSKKANYKIKNSEKRLVEVESLYKKNDFENGAKSIEDLEKAWEDVSSLINETSKGGSDVISLKTKFVSSLDKQSLVLKALSLDLKGDQKLKIEKLLEFAKKTSSSL